MKKNLNKNIVIFVSVILLSMSIIIPPANSLMSKNNENLQSENQLVHISYDENWWNQDWECRKKITINCSYVDVDLTNFPILFHNISSDFSTYAQSDGDDFAFVAGDNSTQYNHEIELYNSTSGELIAWVNITNLSSSSDTILYLYYGNPSASNQENIVGTWNDGYVGVLHLNEGGIGTRYDSTSNDNDGSTGGYEGDEAIENGMIGGADDFDGIDDNIEIADDASLDITGDITISAWVKLEATSGNNLKIVDKSFWGGSTDNTGYRLKVKNDNFEIGVLNNHLDKLNTFAVSNEVWYYVVGTWNGTHLKLYVDGSMQGTPASTIISTIGTNNESACIASYTQGGYYWNGIIDEVRISDVSRSGDWIDTSYETVYNCDIFLSVSNAEMSDTTPPEITDNTPSIGYTGDVFTFNATVTDDTEVYEVVAGYWFGNGSIKNTDMNNTSGDYWEANIIIGNSLDLLHYYFYAEDTYNNGNCSDDKNVTILDNDKPEIENVNAYPSVQMAGDFVDISADVTDNIDVSEVYLYILYPDSTVENFSITESQNGDTYNCNKKYYQGGVHTFHIWACDTGGNTNISEDGTFEIVLGDKPEIPQIQGPTQGKVGTSYSYNFSSTDPDGDDVYYYIDWDDGNIEEWIGPYESGEVITVDHTWDFRGVYAIEAKAKDTRGLESDWGTLEINMPKNKAFNINSFFFRFLELHPNIFPIIRYMLGL